MNTLTPNEAMEILSGQPVAHLAVISDGQPYVTPMSFVLDGERILFRTLAGRKMDAIRKNPKVCVEVSRFDEETGNWVSVIVRGQASLVEDASTRQKVIALLFQKYERIMGSPLSAGGGLMPLGGQPNVIAVAIEEITGMSSDGGFGVRTKPGRL